MTARKLLPCFLFLHFAAFLQARTFTDDTGRAIEAELVSVDGDNVTIKKDAQKFTLPITKFSAEDQDFIKKWEAEKSDPAPAPDAPAPPADAPKSGATLTFNFPELVKDFRGKPAAFTVRIPKNYDVTKPVPLMIFLAGGAGSSSFGGGGLTNDDFVCAALPYPDNGRNPRQANMVGDFNKVWDYWKPMLAKLEEEIPNLDPNLWVIGGFSNGAHALDGLLGEEEFTAHFSAYFLVDGGGSLGGNYRGVRDKHIYYAWGEKSPVAGTAPTVLRRAKSGKMKLVSNEMKGTGHAFPATQKALIKTWLYETVIPDLRPAP